MKTLNTSVNHLDLNNDPEGKKYFSKYLISRGYYNIQTTTELASWDLEADYENKHYYFELKVRPKVALDGTYNDTICELHKIEATPDVKHSYIVNLFFDKMSIIPMTEHYEVQHKMCQKTNNWDKRKVMKDLCSFHNDEKYLYDYV